MKKHRSAQRLALLLAALLCLCGVFSAALAEQADEDALKAQYDAALACFEAGDYEKAYEAFVALGKYEDSRAQARASQRKWKAERYRQAKELYEAERYDEAKEIFKELGDYMESRSYAANCNWRGTLAKYNNAKAFFEAGDFEAAKAQFEALGKFRDSRERAQAAQDELDKIAQAKQEEAFYARAMALKEAGDLVAARDLFIEAGDCKDATAQLYEILHTLAVQKTYDKAAAALENGDNETACVLFEALGNYEDSLEKLTLAEKAARDTWLRAADEAHKTDPARAFILHLYLQNDGAAPASDEAVYAAALALEQEGAYAQALCGFQALGDYMDSAERAAALTELTAKLENFQKAKALKAMRETERANALFATLGDFQDADLLIEPVTEPFSCKQLRDDRTTPMSEVFTAPDGSKHRYRIYKGVHKWVEARAFCEALGGHLATLTTDEENEFVYWYMRGCDKLTAFFGLSDEKREHNWVWVTGEPVEYTNWSPGQPSYSAKERYGMYFYKHLRGTWNDSHFYEDAEVDPGCSFICEWDE